MPQALLRKRVTVALINLQYLEREPSTPTSKTPLLLLHGLLATDDTWADLIANLPSDRRIVALDLLSATPVDPSQGLDVHFASLIELIRDFALAIHLQEPTILGHSHGGVLALSLAASKKMPIDSLILLAPAHPFGGYRTHVVNFYLRRWGRFLALCIPLAPRWAILNAYNEAAGPKSHITKVQLQHYMRVLRSRSTLKRVLEMLKTWEVDMTALQERLIDEPLSQPTYLIWGDADVIVPVSSAMDLERYLVKTERTTLTGIGHLLAEEATQQCASLISTWLIGRDQTPTPALQTGPGCHQDRER